MRKLLLVSCACVLSAAYAGNSTVDWYEKYKPLKATYPTTQANQTSVQLLHKPIARSQSSLRAVLQKRHSTLSTRTQKT
jgi:hypothetical protein